MMECREIVDSVKKDLEISDSVKKDFPNTGCQECDQLQLEFQKNPGGTPPKRTGLILAAVTGGAAFLLSTICVPFVTPALRRVCLPYVPATTKQVQNVFTSLKGRSGSLIDIGSGDGRIVLEAAQNGFKSHGVELNLVLVMYSKMKAFMAGQRGVATFARQDLWKTNFGKYDNVVIFGVEQMMLELEQKLQKEVPSDGVVVACRFPFPNWKPSEEVGAGVDTVWRYEPKDRQQS